MPFRRLMLPLLALLTLGLCQTSCKDDAQPDRATKLQAVLPKAQETASPDDRPAFTAATTVLKIKDLDMAIIGFRVPLPNRTNSVFIMFELEHFDSASVETLAAEALADFSQAKTK